MRRLARDVWIAWRITRLNFLIRLEYRVEFLMMILVGFAWQGSVLVFATVLLSRFPGMGGWDTRDVLLMASMRLLSHAFYMLIMGPVGLASRAGYLDAYILRPMSVYRQIQLAVLNTNTFGNLAVAGVLFAAAMGVATVSWTPLLLAYLAAAIAGGTLMEAAIKTVLASVAMHAPAASHWAQWIEDLLQTFGNYPLHILPALARNALTFVLPLAFIAYLPAAVITGRMETLAVPAALAVASPIVGLLSFVLARHLWQLSLRHYRGFAGT